MQSSSSASAYRQQFIPLLPDSYHRARQHSAPSTISNASIWAPQPQPPGGIWPGNILGLPDPQNHLEHGSVMTPLGFPLTISDNQLFKEDVFGQPPNTLLQNQKIVGAVGDGRRGGSPFREAEVSELSYCCIF